MKTILLTAVGSASAAAVLESMLSLGHRVVGCDIHPKAWNPVSCKVDTFFQAVPVTDTQAYIAQLLKHVQQEHIDALIPLTDVEVDVLCREKECFSALGCMICTPAEATVQISRNKLLMAQTLDKEAICRTIQTNSPYGWQPTPEDFPLLLKPIKGRSSQGQIVVHTQEAFAAALHMREDYIAQPFLSGDVYTVDVARDCHNNVQALTRHELLRTSNGLGTSVHILPGHPLEAICARIAAHAKIVGVVNMEFIHHEGEFYFLEVNPRFSGGIGFSVLAGIDFPVLSLLCYAGEKIKSYAKVNEMIITRDVKLMRTDLQ